MSSHGNESTRNNSWTVGNGVFYAVRAELLSAGYLEQ
jgi:hypothetical protein